MSLNSSTENNSFSTLALWLTFQHGHFGVRGPKGKKGKCPEREIVRNPFERRWWGLLGENRFLAQRSLENRRVFASILDAFPVDRNGEGSSRIWTKRLFKDTIAALVSEHQLELPMIPGFKFDRWLEDQADLLQGLAKKARRNSGGAKSGSTSSLGSAMDAEQTLPYNAEDGEHTYKDIQRIYIYICVYLIQCIFDIYFCRILFLKVHVHVIQLHQFGARGF